MEDAKAAKAALENVLQNNGNGDLKIPTIFFEKLWVYADGVDANPEQALSRVTYEVRDD